MAANKLAAGKQAHVSISKVCEINYLRGLVKAQRQKKKWKKENKRTRNFTFVRKDDWKHKNLQRVEVKI